ncbi:Na+/H+ antiporter [Streptomyces fildesensis]|uniref:Na+/H+ antiporter n=1 Tax=Streptomyces fildesensis TaxID=375757 RepID=A0ABW8C9Z8_9ACTN
MLGLELVVVLGVAVLLCGVLSKRLRVSQPVLQLAVGVVLGFVPALRAVQFPPDVVLLLFLPALLYWESLNTSLRAIRRSLRGIVLVSTLLVIATAGAVAAVAHALGLMWGPAWVLGAAVAPTDATALAAVERLLPHRNLTILKAESLVNDGTALVVYGVAAGVTVGDIHLSVATVSGRVLLAYLGGAAAGALVAWLSILLLRRLTDPLLVNVLALLAPFAAYLIAESVEASGVLAVVVAGLAVSQASPRLVAAASRSQGYALWALATYLLNGTLFVLVGLELQSAVRGLTSTALASALITVLAVSVTLVVVRIAFLFLSAYAIRAIDRRPEQLLRRVSDRSRIVAGLSGFRGAVSLAVALSVPATLDSGAPFPDRDTIVFVTTGVIVLTLVAQGMVLPAVVRWAQLPPDTTVDSERRLAEIAATREALAALDGLATTIGAEVETADRLREEYEQHLRVLTAIPALDDDPDDQVAADSAEVLRRHRRATELRLALLARKRATVIRLRDENTIDDTVLRQIQARLDHEETRLTRVDKTE